MGKIYITRIYFSYKIASIYLKYEIGSDLDTLKLLIECLNKLNCNNIFEYDISIKIYLKLMEIYRKLGYHI